MSSASTLYTVGAEVLGYVGLTASWRRPAQADSKNLYPRVVISEAANADEGIYSPAQAVTISDAVGIAALRDVCTMALGQEVMSTLSWGDGFRLQGDNRSITEAERLRHAASQVSQYAQSNRELVKQLGQYQLNMLRPIPDHHAMIMEAYDYGQFADDMTLPLSKPLRDALRKMAAELQTHYSEG